MEETTRNPEGAIMLNVGQLVQHVETGKFAVYAGFDTPGGCQCFTPELVKMGKDWAHVEDCDGNIDFGDFVKHAGLAGYYLGLIDSDKLGDSDWALIREICARPAQPA